MLINYQLRECVSSLPEEILDIRLLLKWNEWMACRQMASTVICNAVKDHQSNAKSIHTHSRTASAENIGSFFITSDSLSWILIPQSGRQISRGKTDSLRLARS